MDDSDFIPRSLLTSRLPSTSKEAEVNSRAADDLKIESDHLLPDSDKEICYVCNKNLKHLSSVRKSLHINNCLDQQEAKDKFATDKERWASTLDCPMCGEPLQPGPYRAAHAKRCGKKHNIPPARLLVLMETQGKVAEMKKKNGMMHTKLSVPKLEIKKQARIKEEPRSAFEEQMKIALAMSASLDSSNDSFQDFAKDAALVKPSKKANARRSYSFYELEPRTCRCSVFEQIQENFVKRFKKKRYTSFQDMLRSKMERTSAVLGDVSKCIHKLDRLERLADDIGRYCSSGGSVRILSKENEIVLAHRFIIDARAPSLSVMIDETGLLLMQDFSANSLRCYVRFLAAASIEWTENERSEILNLSKTYGPVELERICVRTEKERTKESPLVKDAPMTERLSVEGAAKFGDFLPSESSPQNVEKFQSLDLPICEKFVETEGASTGESTSQVSHEKDLKEREIVTTASSVDDSQATVVFLDDSFSPVSVHGASVWEQEKNAAEGKLDSDIDLNISDLIPAELSEKKHFIVENLKTCCSESNWPDGSSDVFDVASDEDGEVVSGQKAKLLYNESFGKTTLAPVFDDKACAQIRTTEENVDFKKAARENLFKENVPNCSSSNCEPANKSPAQVKRPLARSGPHIAAFVKSTTSLSPILKDPLSSVRRCDGTEGIKNYEKLEVFPVSNDPHSVTDVDPTQSPTEERISKKNEAKKRKRCQAEIQFASTPVIESGIIAKRLKELGSNVKVVKTTNITPVPIFERMTDKELKEELAKYGVRPMGKKKAIGLLKKIYEETHPVVMDESPISSRRRSRGGKNEFVTDASRSTRALFGAEEENITEEALADSTLNVSLDEDKIQEESALDLLDDNGPLPKDIEGMQRALLSWLRREENQELYNHLLTLNPVSFDEFSDRLSRADSSAATIPKKCLIEILDRLHITFRLPDDGWKRKHQKAKMKK